MVPISGPESSAPQLLKPQEADMSGLLALNLDK